MSWRKFSSSDNATANNSKQKKTIYASKVFTDNIIVNHKTDLGSIDISNLTFGDVSYESSSITIKEFMRGPDLSVNTIGVQNEIDTSGVVKFLKPINAPSGIFNKLKGHDASFESLSVGSTIHVKNVSSRKDGSNIVIVNDAEFSSNVEFTDICVNHFNSTNAEDTLVFLSDVSLSIAENNKLMCTDVSVNILEARTTTTDYIEFQNDISVNGLAITEDIITKKLTVSDISLYDISAHDTYITIKPDISVNGNIIIHTISAENITSDVSFLSDISINNGLKADKIDDDQYQ